MSNVKIQVLDNVTYFKYFEQNIFIYLFILYKYASTGITQVIT